MLITRHNRDVTVKVKYEVYTLLSFTSLIQYMNAYITFKQHKLISSPPRTPLLCPIRLFSTCFISPVTPSLSYSQVLHQLLLPHDCLFDSALCLY